MRASTTDGDAGKLGAANNGCALGGPPAISPLRWILSVAIPPLADFLRSHIPLVVASLHSHTRIRR